MQITIVAIILISGIVYIGIKYIEHLHTIMVHVQDVLLVMHVQKEKRKTIVNHPKNQIT